MFKVTLSDVDLLKSTIPTIAEIIDEGVFNINQNGLSLLSPDRTMVSVVDFKLLSTAFDDFKVDAAASLGLNLANLAAVLKRIKSNEKLTIESGSKDNKIKLTVVGNGKRTFEIPLLNVKTEKPPIDQLTFAGRAELDSDILQDGVADAEVIGDSIILEANQNVFKMYSKGDISYSELELNKQHKGLLNLKVDGTIKSQYPLEYLKKMIKVGKFSNQSVIEFGTDYPMRLTFKTIDKMSLSFVLAPRVME